MVLINRSTWPQHRLWAYCAILGTIAAMIAWGWEFSRSDVRPTGSSPVGFTLGVIGGTLIVFEALLWLRKKVRTWRIFGSALTWMKAHIWLGLLCLPISVLHSGFYLGGTLSTVLLIVFLLVIFSGIYGLYLQQKIPKRLLHDVPSETIYSQVDRVVVYLRRDARRLMEILNPDFQSPAAADDPWLNETDVEDDRDDVVVVGAVRTVGNVHGRVPTMQAVRRVQADTERFEQFYLQYAESFLSPEVSRSHPLAAARPAARLFDRLRRNIAAELHEPSRLLEELCQQRRELALQVKLHRRLHRWLWIHLPLSMALVVLLAMHAWTAVLYW